MIHHFKEFLPEALAAFSEREYDAAKDLRRFLKALGLDPEKVCTLRQVHGDEVLTARGPLKEPEADGLVTGESGLALTVRTADCAPVFLLDRRNRAIGLCHAGWRGARAGVVAKTVRAMQDQFGSRPNFLLAGIGPAICGRCYEVGPEFEDYFPGRIRRVGEKRTFDLVAELKSQLADLGIIGQAVCDSGICTACSVDRFFSARREGPETGRLISVVALK